VIDDFKEEIRSALMGYKQHIEKLKKDMEEAERSAEFIRKDIRNLKQKYGFVSESHCCDICGHLLFSRPFYMFPCEHFFHTDCFTTTIFPHLDYVTAQQVQKLQAKLKEAIWSEEEKVKQKDRSRAENESTFTSIVSKVLEFDTDLNIPESDAEHSTATEIPLIEQLQEELDRCVAKECLYCGDLMINSIDLPFIVENEAAEALSWALSSEKRI